MIVDPPEGFVPFDLETPFGKLTLPDRRCLVCLSRWGFLSCTVCCLTRNIMHAAEGPLDEYQEDIQRYIEEHPECVVHPEDE